MPTGYTAIIEEKPDLKFEEFAMRCARAFGAMIMLRDEPLTSDIPTFEPSDYHAKEIDKDHKELSRLADMTDEECQQQAEAERNESIKYHANSLIKAADLQQRCLALLLEVDMWVPPTPDHAHLKKFMQDQIAISTQKETTWGLEYHRKELRTRMDTPADGKAWRVQKEENLKRSLDYNIEENQKEIERTASRNKWVQDLVNSLHNRA